MTILSSHDKAIIDAVNAGKTYLEIAAEVQRSEIWVLQRVKKLRKDHVFLVGSIVRGRAKDTAKWDAREAKAINKLYPATPKADSLDFATKVDLKPV